MLLMVRMRMSGWPGTDCTRKRSAIPKLHLLHMHRLSSTDQPLVWVAKSQEVALTRLVPQPSLSLIQTLGGAEESQQRSPTERVSFAALDFVDDQIGPLLRESGRSNQPRTA
ncbi:hypothetical protein [Mesorhizobium sp. M0195]|uniref:hypothetical protein n=1 Tax=Mesorhizobium sp. M0195 TaxID=2956910 RepID=UPI003339ECBC